MALNFHGWGFRMCRAHGFCSNDIVIVCKHTQPGGRWWWIVFHFRWPQNSRKVKGLMDRIGLLWPWICPLTSLEKIALMRVERVDWDTEGVPLWLNHDWEYSRILLHYIILLHYYCTSCVCYMSVCTCMRTCMCVWLFICVSVCVCWRVFPMALIQLLGPRQSSLSGETLTCSASLCWLGSKTGVKCVCLYWRGRN